MPSSTVTGVCLHRQPKCYSLRVLAVAVKRSPKRLKYSAPSFNKDFLVVTNKGLDFVVDGGIRVADPSTVVDMTGTSPRMIRRGKGPKLPWMASEDVINESPLHGDDVASSAT